MDGDALSMRVLTFRPTAPPATVDAFLRDEILPALCARPQLADAYVARHGDEPADRVITTVWAGAPCTDDEAVLIRRMLPAEIENLGSAPIETLPVRISARFERDRPATILRVARGTVRSGELEAYIAEARAGMLADAAVNAGLIAFYLGRYDADRFVTVSAWTGWDAIAAATGGNLRQPFATRHTSRLLAFSVDHYEILPDTPRPEVVGPDAALLAS